MRSFADFYSSLDEDVQRKNIVTDYIWITMKTDRRSLESSLSVALKRRGKIYFLRAESKDIQRTLVYVQRDTYIFHYKSYKSG